MRVFYFHGLGSAADGASVLRLRSLGLEVLEPGQSLYQPHLFEQTKTRLQTWLQARLGPDDYIAGTSMGGYWAEYCARLFAAKSVIINPCLDPAALLEKYAASGFTDFVSGEQVPLSAEQISAFPSLLADKPELKANKTVILGKQDDVINCQTAWDFYQGYCEVQLLDFGHRLNPEVIEQVVFPALNK